MNQDWLDWTATNLARGCSPAELCDILRSHGFVEAEIRQAMAGQYPLEPKDHGIDYAALAQPQLLQRLAALGGHLYPDERLQLVVLPKFLSVDECERIMALMDSKLRPSTVTTGNLHYGYRTSSTCDLGQMGEPFIAAIDQKIADTLGINEAWAETTQGQKYLVGQEFKAHTDYFQPSTPEYAKFAGERGQRSWTFMIYLNDTKQGGATRFTKLQKEFLPEQGSALIWNNLLSSGAPNPMTEHHGMPVVEGYKSIITKWFRDRGPGGMCAREP
ncbi:2OG-Fe(II) oxygenase [Simiduia curdlanivorans]|uniref:Prolyl hydroxylase family protein n=1 Tax=Simiduia curdlanivorans TaxID=1492769 RepID=A0ABV8V8F1_9GAMM|nr:2OG-Fe(II) oxygenase [Simiduia curdlanivorans]MDN3638679.1 2OG-Fe(II) oxygenase [Simiduia curdlanivorans]